MVLEGRVALVTGGSRGIGKAITAAFVREGATTIICGRKQESLDEAAHDIPGVIPVPCHVGRPEEAAALVRGVLASHGRIDILVNNVATNVAQGPSLGITEAQFDKMIDTNLKSAFRLIQAVAPGMCDRGRGSIINIASIAGLKPQREGMMYSVTKAALIMLTRSYALELGPRGVRVNAIAPGLIQTSFSEYFWKHPESSAYPLDRQPIQHLGQPEEVAETAVLLASERGSYITGAVFTVDGGMTIT
jgi:NAD(P)-dependent dehydrogenase (short-subunit alcohol dehydrogenase family)